MELKNNKTSVLDMELWKRNLRFHIEIQSDLEFKKVRNIATLEKLLLKDLEVVFYTDEDRFFEFSFYPSNGFVMAKVELFDYQNKYSDSETFIVLDYENNKNSQISFDEFHSQLLKWAESEFQYSKDKYENQ